MNIFKILSSNDGSVTEPCISSLLAYLLDRNEDHGLSDLLLRSLIESFITKDKKYFENLQGEKDNKLVDLINYDVVINPEYRVLIDDGKHRDIDILIEICNKGDDKPMYAICLENKIKDSSISKKKDQLNEELEGLKKDYKDNQSDPEIYFLFLTLEESKKSNTEFENLKTDNKIHLNWKGTDSIQEKLTSLLQCDSECKIDPLTTETKFILKSFINFIACDFKSEFQEKKERRNINTEHFNKFIGHYLEQYDFETSIERNKIKKAFQDYVENVTGQRPEGGNSLIRKVTLGEDVHTDKDPTLLIIAEDDTPNHKKVKRFNPQE